MQMIAESSSKKGTPEDNRASPKFLGTNMSILNSKFSKNTL